MRPGTTSALIKAYTNVNEWITSTDPAHNTKVLIGTTNSIETKVVQQLPIKAKYTLAISVPLDIQYH